MLNTPFKGLAPFSLEDAPSFFGRESEQKRILNSMRAHRLTLLCGESGVGRTSLLRAGVAGSLRVITRHTPKEKGAPELVVVFNSWAGDPVPELVRTVQLSLGRIVDGQLSETGGGRCALAESLNNCTATLRADLLVILDQFEEYFVYHDEEEGEGTFATEFPRAVNDPDLPVHFLVSIRDDGLAKLDRFKASIPNLFDNYLRIEHLDLEAARAVIVKSVERYNLNQASDDERVQLEATLVDEVLAGASIQVVPGQAGKARVGASYLQLLMSRLWEVGLRSGSHVLRLETLHQLGGARQILATQLDSVMGKLPPVQQEAAARLFRFMVTPSGNRIAFSLQDLAYLAGIPQAEVEPILRDLVSMRVLATWTAKVSGDALYEVSNGMLSAAIVDWRKHYTQGRELAEVKGSAEQRCRRLEAGVRRLRLAVVALSALLMLALVAAVIAWRR